MGCRALCRQRSPTVLIVTLFLVGAPASSNCDDSFIRGDANQDGSADISDALCTLFHLFGVTSTSCREPDCMDALDTNDDGLVNIADSVYELSWLFQGLSFLPSPGGVLCGPDPTDDALDCADFDFCEDEFCQAIRPGSVGVHRDADLAIDGEGNAIVVWEADVDEDDLFQVRGASYAADGTERLASFTVNATSSGQQFNPVVGVDGTGRFVAVWEDDGDNDGTSQVRARAFNADATERLAQFTVNVDSPGQQGHPDIAVSPTGNFVVVWEDDGNLDGIFEIEGRGFLADGMERIPQFTVNSSGAGQQRDPVIAMDATGDFVVVWEDDGNLDGSFDIEGRAFNADGTERLVQFTANDRGTGQQLNPAIAMDSSGNFIVAWDDDRDGDGNFQVHARAFHKDGTERIPTFTVNIESAGHQINASLAMNATGEFAAAWESDRDKDGEFHVKMRGFSADGTQSFAEAKVDCMEPALHVDSVVGIDKSGRIVIFWDETAKPERGEPLPTQVLGRIFVGPTPSSP